MNKIIKIVSCITILIFLRTGFALAAEQIYFYYPDPAGTPLAMSDASGNVIWKADYKPFGEELLDTATVENNKMFVGKEKDKETGFYYFGARYMESPTGRFISPDSIGPINPSTGEINQLILYDPQRLNAYAYGLNNPYKFVDKDGKVSELVIVVTGIITLFAFALWAQYNVSHQQYQKHLSEAKEHKAGSISDSSSEEGSKKIDENTDMTNTNTWPEPPAQNKPLREGEPSRTKPRERGEKSIYDSKNGEWRPHKPDKYHPEGHWDYKEHPKAPWVNIPNSQE